MLKRVLTWFVPYWRRSRKLIGVVFGLTLLGIVTRTLYPVIFKFIIDTIDPLAPTADEDRARYWIMVLLATGILRELTQAFLPSTRNWLNQSNAMNIRLHHAGTVMRKRHGFFARFQTGDLVTRLTDDIDQMDKLGWYSGSGVFRPIEAVITLVFSLSVMFILHWQLTLAATLVLPLVIWALSRTETLQHKRYLERQKRTSETVEALESAFAGIRIISGFGMQRAQKKLVDGVLVQRELAEKRVIVLHAVIEGLFSIANQAGLIVVLFLGGWLVLKDPGFTLGDFYAFVAYLSGLTMPLWTISWFFVSSNVADTSIERLREIADEEERREGTQTMADGKPALELRNLSFAYQGKQPLLSDVSFRVSPGETVALVGPVGCGKTTLLDCAVGLIEPDKGQVLLGEQSLTDLQDKARADALGYAPQEPRLFSGTVSENVSLGRATVDDDAVALALQTAQISGEVSADETVAQAGKDLSGGQRGRISVARAIAGKPSILVLDDVTSALDARTEQAFWAMLRRDLPEAAILVSTHREVTAQRADRVLWLQDGVILHEGCHEDLLDEPGYQRLFAMD